jgi:radical SAM protein with 4Fe4S-binding SPASM domain
VVLQRRVAARRAVRDEAVPDTARSTRPADFLRRSSGVNDGNGFVFVSHRGVIHPSGFLPEPCGNVRRERLRDVYRDHPTFVALRDAAALKGKCGVCEFRHVCGGSRARAFAMTGDWLEADPLCAYEPPAWRRAVARRAAAGAT